MQGVTSDTPTSELSGSQLYWLEVQLTRNGEPEEGDLRFEKLAAVRMEMARRVGVSGLGEGETFHHPV